jgi:hypothetical protein
MIPSRLMTDWEKIRRGPTPPTIVALPKQLRVLRRVERKEFRVQVIQAAIYAHPNGQELRVFMEPEEKNDLLWSSVQRFDFTPLEAKAAELREVLLEKGWTHLA